MSTKLGSFEILSELAKSPTSTVYKANDESGQTIALKAIQLSAFGENAAELEQALLAESEATKVLSSSNIANVTSASVIEGQFCAVMEYIQGNSIATMLARKEGFSIWDLLDIGRQLSTGLEHAKSHNIVHYSLEPSKIMCGWDGTVKILSYGVSSVGNFLQHLEGEIPSMLYYMSPEQVRGEATDARSNLFSLGAMFYEMVTERKAFDREDAEGLRQSILESTPVAPVHVNPKIHPVLSDLIMKALAKDPAERYQSGRELLDDLEKCKESKPAAKKTEAPKSAVAPVKPNATAQAKFVSQATAKPATATYEARASGDLATCESGGDSEAGSSGQGSFKAGGSEGSAAAAGVGGDGTPSSGEVPEIDLSNQFSSANATVEEPEMPSAHMSAAVADEPEVETFEPAGDADAPRVAVDPMMAEGGAQGGGGVSFSEMTELPPLKEVYIAPPPPPVAPAPVAAPTTTVFQGGRKADEKPKVQPREVAEKAIKEIKNVPPKLMLYSIAGAVVLILIIGIAVTFYVHSLNSDIDPDAGRPVATQPEAQPAPSQPVATQPAPAPAPAPQAAAPVESEPASARG